MNLRCKRLGCAACLGLLLVIVAGRSVQAEDWPFVRNDVASSGMAAGQLSDEMEELWTYKVPSGGFEATAVVENGVLYVGDNDGSFHAVRVADGQQVWTKTFEQSGFLAGGAVRGENVYAADYNGAVRAFSTADGSVRWTAEVDAEVYAGPTLRENDLLVTTEAGTLVCLNVADGHERWTFRIGDPLRCSPAIVGGRVMLAGCDAKLHLLDPISGEEIKTIEIDGPTASAGSYAGRAYLGTRMGTLFAFDLGDTDQNEPGIAWTYVDPDRDYPIQTTPAASDALVVFGSDGKAVYALDPVDGTVVWQIATRSKISSSPVIVGNRVVVATYGGKLMLLDAISGEIKWEFDAGGRFLASPVVVDDRLLVGNSDGTLYCFGTNGEN